ncbi:pectinesterase family protein [Catenovulum sp. 2E275]|uniref:pectinesterase family protein n=1 Tax=Catenovulum sp. 2E275 TaxID=2980497 RepID=UPI0021D3DFF8|nr:pectinesterase family protein [Catenovulum sp. 2E275]MCU4674159.1 pectinesterase family protein [Catenovulum sp. 2E275]
MKTIWISVLLVIASFGVHAKVNYKTELVVAKDGSGDFSQIQQAIYATKTFPDVPIKIYIKDGIYNEKVEVYSWNTKVSLIGESRDGTIITYNDHFDKIDKGRNSTFHTFTLKVAGNDFHAENLTVINSAGPVGQAVALHVEADRASFLNVSLKGNQDTLYLAGEGARTYFKNCYVEGTTDFIFGEGTALFENCEIKSLSNSFVTAASTPQGQPFGFVFNQCKLTAAKGVDQAYLGRPWRRYAKTVFINSEFGAHILPIGWDNWNSTENEKTVFYAEYGNTGKGAQTKQRASWSQVMVASQAADYTKKNILGDWQPAF